MRNIIPVVMAGIIGIYGLIVAIILQGAITHPTDGNTKFSSFSGYAFLASGLCCGISYVVGVFVVPWLLLLLLFRLLISRKFILFLTHRHTM